MMFPPQLPLAAYRDDRSRAAHAAELTVCDGELVSIGVLLTRCTQLRSVADSAPETSRLRAECLALATRALQTAERSVPWSDPSPVTDARVLSLAIRSVADIAEDGGALRLANSLLHLACEELGKESGGVETGRIVAQRGRVARKSGDAEAASALYVQTMEFAQRENSDELRARAEIGLGLLARQRGNMPAMRIHFTSALDAATRGGLRDQAAMAHHGLMLVAASAGALDEAIVHAWAAFRDVTGNALREVEALVDLGQAILDFGEPETALRTYAAALSRPLPTRAELPALGGAAIAAATLEDRDMVHRIVARIETLSGTGDLSFLGMSAKADVVSALMRIQDPSTETRRTAVMHAASAAGFHEIAFRMEHLRATKPEPVRDLAPTSEVRLVFQQCDAMHPGAVHTLLALG